MKSALAIASLAIFLSSPTVFAAPLAQSSPLQGISSLTPSSSDSQILLKISTLNPDPVNQNRRADYMNIPINFSAHRSGSYLEGFAELTDLDVEDGAAILRSSNGKSKNSAGVSLHLSTITFANTDDVENLVCSFRIAEGVVDSAGAESGDVENDEGNLLDNSTNESYRISPNFGINKSYGKPFPVIEDRAILGIDVAGGSDKKANGVYCVAGSKKQGDGELELGAARLDDPWIGLEDDTTGEEELDMEGEDTGFDQLQEFV